MTYPIVVVPQELLESDSMVAAIRVQPIKEWEYYDEHHEGLTECSHVVHIVTFYPGVDLPYDGLSIPMQTVYDDTQLVAPDWYEVHGGPDLQGATREQAMLWLAEQ